jgi:hypothetical protein
MPYFHVLAGLDQSPEALIAIFMDLSESELKTRFVKPYSRGQDVVSKNNIFAVKSLRKLHVIRTERQSDAELLDIQRSSREAIDRINRESRDIVFISAGQGYKPEDIVHGGADVTETYISGPPGSASRSSFGTLVNNGWVVGVGGGLLVAALAWFLGWN